ncbi:hypothetical protein Tco_0898956 [Tanacetum coccineum]
MYGSAGYAGAGYAGYSGSTGYGGGRGYGSGSGSGAMDTGMTVVKGTIMVAMVVPGVPAVALVEAMWSLVSDEGVVLLWYQVRCVDADVRFWEECGKVFMIRYGLSLVCLVGGDEGDVGDIEGRGVFCSSSGWIVYHGEWWRGGDGGLAGAGLMSQQERVEQLAKRDATTISLCYSLVSSTIDVACTDDLTVAGL